MGRVLRSLANGAVAEIGRCCIGQGGVLIDNFLGGLRAATLPCLQLHPCADGALSQRWSFGGNGSIYSLDHAGTLGYCLDISGNQHPPQHGAKAGQQVFASNCGQSRADPYGWASLGLV